MPKITLKTEVAEMWEEKIKECMNNIIKFTKAKEKAEAGIATSKKDLSIIMKMLDLEEPVIETTSQGKFTLVAPTTSKSFKKLEAKTMLASKGIDIDLINDVWDKAHVESEKSGYVKWDKPKAKKKK